MFVFYQQNMIGVEYKYATKCEFLSETWYNIGKLLYNLSNGSKKGFKLWVMYCETDFFNFDEYHCYTYWDFLSSDYNFSFEDFEDFERHRNNGEEPPDIPDDY